MLILTNFVIFFAEYVYTNGFRFILTLRLFSEFGLVPYNLYSGFENANVLKISTLLTSMFLHANLIHIAGNMLFLFVFGGRIEQSFGHGKYLLFYLFSGITGALVHTLFSLYYGYPDNLIPTVGASAAISGVLGAYLVLYPNSSIIALIGYFIIPARALWFIGLWFLIQVVYVFLGISTGVAYWAHIGGFLTGAIVSLLARKNLQKNADEYY